MLSPENAPLNLSFSFARKRPTAYLLLGLKAVSSVPSVFNRAMLLRVTPETLEKPPPMRILPSG